MKKYDYYLSMLIFRYMVEIQEYNNLAEITAERMKDAFVRSKLIKKIYRDMNNSLDIFCFYTAIMQGNFNEYMASISITKTAIKEYVRKAKMVGYKRLYTKHVLAFLERDDSSFKANHMINAQLTNPVYDILKWESYLEIKIQTKVKTKFTEEQFEFDYEIK